jgi:hypothetical protein
MGAGHQPGGEGQGGSLSLSVSTFSFFSPIKLVCNIYFTLVLMGVVYYKLHLF